jgi:hypothetical protein
VVEIEELEQPAPIELERVAVTVGLDRPDQNPT